MIHLELSEAEQQMLLDLLETSISDLRMEIVDTDNQMYKKSLHERKEALQQLLNRLQQAAPA